MAFMLIYCVTNERNGKRYVGKTVSSLSIRWSQHKSSARYGRRCALHAAIRKYGAEVFRLEVLAECSTLADLDRMEMEFIARLETRTPKGYNLTSGGDYVFDRTGFKLSAEHRAKISAGTKGHKPCEITPEWRAKQRASHLGQRPTLESRLKRGASLKGHAVSEETRRKIGDAHRGMIHSPEARKRMSEGMRRSWAARSKACAS